MNETQILVADDCEKVAAVLRRVLGGPGTRVLWTFDGLSAIELARVGGIDMVILDVNMPGMDGFSVCSSLRRDFRTRHIPIMMLTGRSASADELRGLEYGADDYVTKPFDNQNLKARVQALLRQSRFRTEVNPLTRLPGNRTIRKEVEDRLGSDGVFWFTYADIRHFKLFNDRYGFSMGDKAIRCAAGLICETAERLGGGFVGHIGGDDFVLVTDRPVDAAGISAAFESRIRMLLDEDRPSPIGLTLGLVRCVPGAFEDFEELARSAAHAKEQEKQYT